MPGYDGTGPGGMGPMTGGGRGFCGTADRGGHRGFGRRTGCAGRFGRGMGAGRGWGASPFPAGRTWARNMSETEELEMLRAESEQLSLSLDAVRKRIESLEKAND